MNNNSILIIDDEVQIRRLLSITLEMSKYKVLVASNAKEGIMAAAMHSPTLIILDLGLPDEDGQSVLRKLREWYKNPIIILSARTHEEEIVKALDSGANDYLTKPFHNGELLARIRSAIRSIREEKDQSAILSFGDLTIDMPNHCVKKKNEIIKLTSTEFSILSLMAQNAGKVLTHQYLLKEVWGMGCSLSKPTPIFTGIYSSIKKKDRKRSFFPDIYSYRIRNRISFQRTSRKINNSL